MPAIVTYNNSTIATVNDSATLKTKGKWSPYDIAVRDVAEDSYAIAFIDRTISSIPSSASATVTSIGSYAFASCCALTTASFPNVTSIGSYAFQNCTSLTTASFPNVTTIRNYAFQSCTSLSTASFPSATTIGSYAFRTCTSLSTASFPNVTSIGGSAFLGCTSLTTASFPNVTNIEIYAFRGCSKLSSLYLTGSSVASLGGTNAFTDTPMSLSTYLGYYGSIYVPTSLLTNYKTATNWSAYSSRFVGI